MNDQVLVCACPLALSISEVRPRLKMTKGYQRNLHSVDILDPGILHCVVRFNPCILALHYHHPSSTVAITIRPILGSPGPSQFATESTETHLELLQNIDADLRLMQ